ncbi:hypothetical protein SL054_001981, partial [Flavobacterium psychrophilum]|nr:hypothetical protein [Flavobacterium psychrophilum]
MKKIILLFALFPLLMFSQEKSKLQNNFKFIPIYEWKEGMKFIFEKSSTSHILYLYDKKIKGDALMNSYFYNKILIFKRFEQKPTNCLNDNCKKVYFIFECNNIEYAYQYELFDKPLSSLKYIPDLIYYTDYENCKNIFLDKKFYIREKLYPYVEQNTFEPIIITKIEINSVENPVKITYIDEKNYDYNLNLKLSGINSRYDYSCYDKERICEFNYSTIITEEEYLNYKNEKQDLEKQKKIVEDSLRIQKENEY